MRRGELYRVRHPTGDPKRSRVFVVVSRQALLDSSFSSCDNLVSIAKAALTDYVGARPPAKLSALNAALRLALEL